MQNDKAKTKNRAGSEKTAFLGIRAKLTGVFLENAVEKVSGV